MCVAVAQWIQIHVVLMLLISLFDRVRGCGAVDSVKYRANVIDLTARSCAWMDDGGFGSMSC